MDPFTISTLVGAGGSLLGGLLGSGAAEEDRAISRRVLQQMLDAYKGLPENPLTAQQLGQSAMEGVSADPSLVGAQEQMLGHYQDIANSHGLTLGDRAGLEVAQNEASRRAGAERAALEGMLRNRGLGNSGAAVALRVGGQRESANTGANVALQTQQEAQRRQLEAMRAGGAMAGQMRGERFSEDARRAQAKDMFAQYNAQARTNAQQGNASYGLQRLSGMTNAAAGVSGNANASADRTQRAFADVGTGLGQAGAAMISHAQSPQQNSLYADSNGLYPTLDDRYLKDR
jgi:hypothetical protein